MRNFTYNIEFNPKFAYLYALNVLKGSYSGEDEGLVFSSVSPKYACLYAVKIKKDRLCDRLHSEILLRMIENTYNSIDKRFVKAYIDFVTKNESKELESILCYSPGYSSSWSEENIEEIKCFVTDDYCCDIEIDHNNEPEWNDCTAVNGTGARVSVSESLSDILFGEYYDEIEENCHQYDYEDVYDAPTDDEA